MQKRKDRNPEEKRSRILGAAATLAFHAALLSLVSFSSLKYIYPPPEEKAMLIEFEELEVKKPQRMPHGTAPRAIQPDTLPSLTRKRLLMSPASATPVTVTCSPGLSSFFLYPPSAFE